MSELFIVSGPSGVGKDTILSDVIASSRKIVKVITTTTRLPRWNEEHGRDYYFIDEVEFLELVTQGKFLEYANFAGNFYGSSLDVINTELELGNDVLLILDVQGAMSVRHKITGTFIFIAPPSLKELEERLRARNSESEEVIARRLLTARHEMEQTHHYDYIIINNDLEEAVKDFQAIIRARKCLNLAADVLA